jgi:hypothetical protein
MPECNCGIRADYRIDLGADGALHFCTRHLPSHLALGAERITACDDCGAAGATAHGEAKRCSRCASEVEEESALDARVRIESDDDDPIECTLAEFLDDNAEGLAEGEREAIIAAIARGASYAGGGGAAPSWTLRWIADE